MVRDTVHKRDIVIKIADKLDFSNTDTGEVIQAFLEEIMEILSKKDRIELRNFGIFEVVHQSERTLKHPITGKPINIPPQRVIRFKAGKQFKEMLNKKEKRKRGIGKKQTQGEKCLKK